MFGLDLSAISTGMKLAVGGAILAVILIVVGVIMYQHHEVGSLQQANGAASATIAVQAQANSEAQATIAGQTATAQNTDQTTQVIQKGQQQNSTTQAGVEANTTTQVAQSNQQFQQQQNNTPAPVVKSADDQRKADAAATAVLVKHSTDLAVIQINSLWDTYANTCDKTDPQCVAAQPAPTTAQ